MEKRPLWIALGLLVGAGMFVGGIWLLTRLLPTHEPKYGGKPLASWIAQSHSSDSAARKSAEDFLSTRVIPQLMLAADNDRDPAWKLWLVLRLNELPGVNISYDAAGSRRQWAVYNIGAIGPLAKSAVPYLLNKLRNDRDQQQRSMAAIALGLIKADADKVVPILIACLSDDGVREGAARGLGHYGDAAKAAVPLLVKMFDTRNKDAIEAALDALREIDPTAIPGGLR